MARRSDPMARDREDLTLDDIRDLLAPRIIANAVFDGWTNDAVRNAARESGIDEDVAIYAFKAGQMEMLTAAIAHVDREMALALPQAKLAEMKIRDRILTLIRFRLEAFHGREEALRRALAIMAMPQNVLRALRLGWRSADLMWSLAGDTSTDYNYYSKRSILGGIYGATLAVFVDDDSDGKAETLAFLERRIAGVMRFEKAKAQWLSAPEDRFSMARFLGRLRYPAK